MKFSDFVINESIIEEGAVKQFEMGMSSLINNIKSGYGWIDPSYVEDTVKMSDDFEGIEWDKIKDEVYQRLIKSNLLYFSSSDPEQKGKKVISIKQIKESIEVNEGNKDEQVKKECISRLSDFFRVAPHALSKFNFDGKDNIKELTRALNSTSDQGTELYYQTAIKSVKRDLGINESEVNEGTPGYTEGTLNTPFEIFKSGDKVKLDALDFTRRGDDEKITCIASNGSKIEIPKKYITVRL